MLVLSRSVWTETKPEGIWIGQYIWVQVCLGADGRVKLGISAPDGVGIWREDIAPDDWQTATSEKFGGLLVLSVKEKDRILLTGGIVITAVDIRRGEMRIGIEAPKSVGVQRSEVRNRPSKAA